MKYRELMESCDRILESPEIKMFDQYILVNDFKNFYLESHNFIKDNIMSLPYEFSNGIYSEYFIEEEEVGAAKANGDGNKKSNSSGDGGWTKDSNGQYKYKEGDHFINALKAIANFFIRILEVIKGAWNTIFKTGNEYDWVSGARKTVASSADSPGAPTAAMAHSARAMANINGTLEAIDHSPFLQTEYGNFREHFKTILDALHADKRKEYEEVEANWIDTYNTSGAQSDLKFINLLTSGTLIPSNLTRMKLDPMYVGAKIRIRKIEKNDKNEDLYADNGSKGNEQNYDIKDLTESLLIDLANNYANSKIEETMKDKSSEEKEKAKPAKIEEYFNQTLKSLNYKVRKDYSIANSTEDEIEMILHQIRNTMRESDMTPEEKAVHQAISTIQINCIQLVVGVMDSAVSTLEKMWEDTKSINNVPDDIKAGESDATNINKLNSQEREKIVMDIQSANSTLFGMNGYERLLNQVASIVNIQDKNLQDENIIKSVTDNENNSGNKNKLLDRKKYIDTDEFKFDSIGKQIFTSIFLLMLDDFKGIIDVSPNIDKKQVEEGINQIGSILGLK